MMIRITTEDLIDRRACEPGFVDFEAAFGDRLEVKEWTAMHQAVILGGPLKRWWGWTVRQGLIPAYPMRGWDLRRANLCGADLWDVDLSGADLYGANLHDVDLLDVDLTGADLTGAYRPEGGIPGWVPDVGGWLRREER